MQAFLAWGFNTVEIANYLGVSSKTVRRARAKIRTLGLLMGSALCPQSGQCVVRKVDMSTKQTHRVSAKQTNGNGTEIALARASDPTPNSSPDPQRDQTSSIGIQTASQAASPQKSGPRPIYALIRQAFLSKCNAADFDFKREGRAMVELEKRCLARENPEEFAKRVLVEFWRLTNSGDKLFGHQPFRPSILASGGLWPRVIKRVEEATREAEPMEVFW